MTTALRTTTALAALMAAVLIGTPAGAQEKGGASEGSGETSRAAPMDDFKFRSGKPIASPKVTDEEASRDAPFDDEAWLVNSLTAVGHSPDGTETKVPPNDALMGMIKSAAGTDNSKQNGDNKQTTGKAEGIGKNADPALAEGTEAERQVFGNDDRVAIPNTQTYPFRTIGYIQAKSKDGSYGSCSGTLIGPRTVLTAAHCLYNHDQKDWLDEVVFVPGMNGPETVPYGGYEYETAYVVQGFIDNYQDSYGSVTPWDLGVMILKDPIGDDLGWLGYANYDDLGDFSANIVGYPGDKPPATMWRSTCDVIAENIDFSFFNYDCDTYPGSSGSSVYTYNSSTRQRIVLGVNIAESPTGNLALRLNAGYVEWINALYR